MRASTGTSKGGKGTLDTIYCITVILQLMNRSDKRDERIVRITVDLPEPLWKAAKVRAAQEGRPLRAVMMDALKRYLRERLT
jgi:hypothetical protein